ncbi:MAG: choline/carnitine O-acyltransferase [Propioniciclava sp.]
MKPLPVPPLAQTLQRYLAAVGPLSDEAQFAATAAVVEAYATKDGAAHQQALEAFAAQEARRGRSWLAEAWLAGYLTVREPLPLTTSVGFLVNWPGAATGLDRAADFLHRLAAVHLDWLRGDLEPELTGRGEQVDPVQRAYLAGGIRAPGAGTDTVVAGLHHAENREMVVLWRGVPYAVAISAGDGQPLSRPALVQALGTIVARPEAQQDFAELSYLGSPALARLLPTVLADPANAATYDRLTRALFVVNLDGSGDEDTFLSRATVGIGQAWAYKPVTYQIALAEGHLAVHVEHSTFDGAALKNVIGLAQARAADDSPRAADTVEALPWSLPEGVVAEVANRVERYRAQAGEHRVHTVPVGIAVPDLPFRVSSDAVAQIVMAYAQRASYGRLRSTYEAVDMREYQAGRTECLRPLTGAMVALVEALLAERAGRAELEQALAAHKGQVIACKSGQAIDRHLFGLRLMAERENVASPLHDDDGYRRLTTDFLSTTSLGDPHQIVRFAFAPTSPGGIGISYGANADVYEFCLNYRADERGADIETFIENLTEAGRRIERLLGRIAGEESADQGS